MVKYMPMVKILYGKGGIEFDAARHGANVIESRIGELKAAGDGRSIVRAADVILYDEPTSGLDPVSARTIDRLIARLNRERGITSVIVTHDLPSALRTADRILLLKGGKAVFCGTTDAFVASEIADVREFVDAVKDIGGGDEKKE